MIKISDNLKPENILILNEKCNKRAVLQKIATLAAADSALSQKTILQALLKREALSSTGLANGIAIPHCQIDSLSHFYFGVVISKNGIKFDSLDGKKTHIFFYIICPADKKEEHLKYLSGISRLLTSNNLSSNLINANTASEALELIKSASIAKEFDLQKETMMQFQIVVSNETLFSAMLEIAVEHGIKSITVLEGESASSYLYKMPLFASFWEQQEENYRRIIIFNVQNESVTPLIQEFYSIPKISEMENEFSLNVIKLFYAAGKLQF